MSEKYGSAFALFSGFWRKTLQRWKEMDYGKILCNEEQFSALGNEKICPTETISKLCLLLYMLGVPAGIALKILLENTLRVANYGIIIPSIVFAIVLFQYIVPKLLLVLVPWVSKNTDKKAEKIWTVVHEPTFQFLVLIAEVMFFRLF